MHTGHTRRAVSLATVVLALVALATVQVRAESAVVGHLARFSGVIAHTDLVLFGNTDGGAVGTVQDSIGRGGHGGSGHDTTGQYKRDSVYNSWRQHQHALDSISHVRDSINRAFEDSVRKAHQGADTNHRGRGDSTSHHVRDSVHHVRDSVIRSIRDSNHVIDSTRHVHLDSLRHAINDTIHVRDSLFRGRRDSLHVRDSINDIIRDSLIRVWRDSIHVLDSIRHARRDTTHHGFQANGPAELGKSGIAPEVLTLSQNYPNPFGGAGSVTAIDFALPSDQQVSLTVFNVAGQQVATVTNGMMKAGTHSVTFDATGLQAGMYFYKLVTETGTLTKRMIKVH